MTCPHVGSGCNAPEGECLGFCLNKGNAVQYKTGTKITCKDDGQVFIVTESTAEVTKYRNSAIQGECPTPLLADQLDPALPGHQPHEKVGALLLRSAPLRPLFEQADVDVEEALHVATQAAKGELDPNAARLLVDTLKWRAARFHRNRYGDKASVEVTGDAERPVEVRHRWRFGDQVVEF